MNFSRFQYLLRKFKGLVATTLYHCLFLRKCGKRVIVFNPLSWTPRFIELNDHVSIGPLCRIEAYDSYRGQQFTPKIILEKGVSLEQCCHIGSIGDLTIGQGTTISSFVSIHDVEHSFDEVGIDVLHQKVVHKPVAIGRNCFIGSGARILPGTELGDGCIVGANAVVKGKFPANVVVVGVPAKIVKKMNLVSNKWESVVEK